LLLHIDAHRALFGSARRRHKEGQHGILQMTQSRHLSELFLHAACTRPQIQVLNAGVRPPLSQLQSQQAYWQSLCAAHVVDNDTLKALLLLLLLLLREREEPSVQRLTRAARGLSSVSRRL